MTIDFKYDEGLDIAIEDGDLVLGDVTYQNINDVLMADRGWFRFDPLVGAGLTNFINNDFINFDFIDEIQKALEYDGVVIRELRLVDGDLKIEAVYSRPKTNYVSQRSIVNKTGQVKVEVNSEQNIFDLATIHYGDADAVWKIFEDNFSFFEVAGFGDYNRQYPKGFLEPKNSGITTVDLKAWRGSLYDNQSFYHVSFSEFFPPIDFYSLLEAGDLLPKIIVDSYRDGVYYNNNPELATIGRFSKIGIGYWYIGNNFLIQ